MHLLLDGSGPLHAQLTRALKHALITGRMNQGSQFPPSRMLARELGLSRTTVLTAYDQLRAEGFLTGRVGSGSYVTPPLLAGVTSAPPMLTARAQSNFSHRARAFHDRAGFRQSNVESVRCNFQYGLPLGNPALASAWGRELARAAVYTDPSYPQAQGLPTLRAAICDYLARRRGIHATPDEVLVVNGTQQAMTLLANVLLNEGDHVAIEEPQYFVLRELLQIFGARITGVGVDRHGLRCDALPATSPQLICVTPSHQFPSGAVLSQSRRVELLEYARRHQSWIFEDDYDGEFRFASKPLPALRSMDRDGRVVYAGTFSKAMFPALRLGYIVMPAALREDLITAKWVNDFGTASIEQAALANFMGNGGFERHLRRMNSALHQRRSALLRGLRDIGGDFLDIADSEAGMHVVVWLRDKSAADGEALIERGRKLGLGLHSVLRHYLEPPDRAGLLMGYAGLTLAEIQQGLGIFRRLLEEAYGMTA